ncbi:MAG: CsbD family protein, partial [Methanosarcina sp.]
MKEGTKEEMEGKFSKAKGEIKESAGEMTGDIEMEAKGEAEKRKGEAQEKVGKIRKEFEKSNCGRPPHPKG